MNRSLKFYSCALLILTSADSYSNEITNYGDIKIKANTVIFDEVRNELLLEKNVLIRFGIYTIIGNQALLSYEKKKLMIDGSPASIASKDGNVNGTAKSFIIYPNFSLEMLGAAKLFEDNNSIYAEKITYQIKSND